MIQDLIYGDLGCGKKNGLAGAVYLTFERYGINSSHEDSGIGELLLSSRMLWGKDT